MVTPYSAEEFLAVDAEEPVRRPRRRAGRSPQDLTTIIVTDYTLNTRAWLPTAAMAARRRRSVDQRVRDRVIRRRA